MAELQLHFGAMCHPIADQLAEQGLTVEDADHFQRDADAITRLTIRGVLTEAETHKARKRLFKRITAGATTTTDAVSEHD